VTPSFPGNAHHAQSAYASTVQCNLVLKKETTNALLLATIIRKFFFFFFGGKWKAKSNIFFVRGVDIADRRPGPTQERQPRFPTSTSNTRVHVGPLPVPLAIFFCPV